MCWGLRVRIRVKPVLRQQKTLETMWFQGFRMVRGTGLELTRHHISLYYPVSKSTANKTSVEVVYVRQR